MFLPRFPVLLLAMPLLAACDNSPQPPATPPPTAEAPASAPAAPAPAQQAPAAEVASDENLAPLFGTWAADLADCGTAAITISPTRFEGAENSCDITEMTDNGNGSYTAALSCTGEGQAATERVSIRPLFAPTGEGIGLIYLDRDNAEATVLRCETTPN